MRTFLPTALFFALLVNLHAAVQTLDVSPASLTGWTITGADRINLGALPNLALPAGAQLSRTFHSSVLGAHLSTQPILGTKSVDWPVLEIGSAALLFARDISGGKFILVVGDSQPVSLPITFPLDAEGRSMETLTVGFAQNGGTLTVAVGGKELSYPIPHDPTADRELVISAGVAEPWMFDTLTVNIDADTAVAEAGKGLVNDLAVETQPKANAAKSKAAILPSATTSATNEPGAIVAASDSAAGAKIEPVVGLEIFTPPAVRRGRAEAIRATVETTQSK